MKVGAVAMPLELVLTVVEPANDPLAPLPGAALEAASGFKMSGLPSLEELAAAHTALLLSRPLPSRFVLAGYSFGGLLACEVAHSGAPFVLPFRFRIIAIFFTLPHLHACSIQKVTPPKPHLLS